MKIPLFTLLILAISCFKTEAGGGESDEARMNILILLDASFSMKEKWQSRTKFEIAANLLVELIDEAYKEDPGKHFAFRLFGHQSGMSLNDCFDTEQIVPFEQRNIDQVKRKLNDVYPKGWSPIALSLERAIYDFDKRKEDFNALIFITDGGETCDGDPCTAAKKLYDAGVVTMPFVIGLGKSDLLVEDVGCIGEYQQVDTEDKLREGLQKIMDKIDLQTTAQLYFINNDGNRNETDITFSFRRSLSAKMKDNFVHALDENNLSDTIILSAIGEYDLIAHTTPELVMKDIKLIESEHNTIEMVAERGVLSLELNGYRGFADFECIIRDALSMKIVDVQKLNTVQSYLIGKYDLEITSFPRTFFEDVVIAAGETTAIHVNRSGNVLIKNGLPILGSIYVRDEKQLMKVRELYEISGSNSYTLQPGEYIFIYNYSNNKPQSTIEFPFSIESGRVTTIDL